MKFFRKFQNINVDFAINLINLISFFVFAIGIIILRYFKIIEWNWFFVLLPIGIPILISTLLLVLIAIFLIIDFFRDPECFNISKGTESLEPFENIKEGLDDDR